MPVGIDWFAKRKGVRLDLTSLGVVIAEAIKDSKPVGIMLHHALMDKEERGAFGELLALLASFTRAQCRLMRDIVEAQPKAKAGSAPIHF